MHLSPKRHNLINQALNYNDLPKVPAEAVTAAAEKECSVNTVQADHSKRFETCVFIQQGRIHL